MSSEDNNQINASTQQLKTEPALTIPTQSRTRETLEPLKQTDGSDKSGCD